MKRVLAALAGTLVGLGWIISYRVTPEHVRSLDASAAAPSPDAPQPAPDTSPSAPVAPTPTPPPTVEGSFTGAPEPNFYGTVQVKVSIRGGRITDVQAVQLPSDRARSAYISQVAGPMLRSEVIQAQSARIDIVSGATYTSESYAESVLTALKQAHFGA